MMVDKHFCSQYALDYNDIQIALDNGNDPNIQDHTGNSQLHYAAFNGDLEITRLLVNHGANIFLQNWRGRVPAHYAAMSGHVEVFRYLTDMNSSYNQEDYDGYKPYDFACLNGHLGIVKILVEEMNVTPTLLTACKTDNNELMQYMLSVNAKPCVGCLFYVIRNHNVLMFRYIIGQINLDATYVVDMDESTYIRIGIKDMIRVYGQTWMMNEYENERMMRGLDIKKLNIS